MSCRCWSVEWSPGHLLTQSLPCWCRTRSRRWEDCDRFRNYVPEVHFSWKCQDREVLAQRNGHESCSHECNGEVAYFPVTLSVLSTIPDHPHLMKPCLSSPSTHRCVQVIYIMLDFIWHWWQDHFCNQHCRWSHEVPTLAALTFGYKPWWVQIVWTIKIQKGLLFFWFFCLVDHAVVLERYRGNIILTLLGHMLRVCELW